MDNIWVAGKYPGGGELGKQFPQLIILPGIFDGREEAGKHGAPRDGWRIRIPTSRYPLIRKTTDQRGDPPPVHEGSKIAWDGPGWD